MKIFGWAADKAGCYYYRLEQPMQALAETCSWDVAHGTKFIGMPEGRMSPEDKRLPAFAKEAVKTLDLVITQRTCNRGPTVFLDLLRKAGMQTVYEIDDDLFNIDPRSNASGFEFYGRAEIRHNLKANIAGATRVTVSTPKLAEVVAPYNRNVHVCPNAVPDWLLEHARPASPEGKVTIGWGGSATHAMDFSEVAGQLRKILEWHPETEFHTIGANYAPWMRLPADRVRSSRWVENVPDYYRTIDFDIGIAPLRPQIFNHSKSAIKALELAALGIPVVASDVGPYRDFVQHGVTGFLVKQEHMWSRHLRDLINDPAMRTEMGANGRKLAAEYTTSALLPNWIYALTEDF